MHAGARKQWHADAESAIMPEHSYLNPIAMTTRRVALAHKRSRTDSHGHQTER